jgi:tellurite resistance protein
MRPNDRKTMPVAFFGIAVGTLALSNAWRVAAMIWHVGPVLCHVLAAGSLALWLLLVIVYALKWLLYPALALEELRDPQRSYFFALLPVASLLAATALIPYARNVAVFIFIAAVATQLAWGVVAHGRFWMGTHSLSIKTPATYLSAVAPNLVSAATASALGWTQISLLFFGVGVMYWLLIETLVLGGVANNREMDKTLRPVIGIQLAPPVVAGIAWLNLHGGTSDVVSHLLLGYGLYQVLLMLRLLPWIMEQPFATSYWAFSFGVVALPTMAMRMVVHGETGFVAWLAPVLFAAANLIVALLGVKTLALLFQGRLLPAERAQQPRIAQQKERV